MMGYTLEQLVDQVPPETKERVEYVKREFSQKIHNILRTETGFRLSKGGKRPGTARKNISVPVELLPGVPEELRHIEIPEDQEWPMRLAPWRRELEHFINSGTSLSTELFPILNDEIFRGRGSSFLTSIDLAKELLEIAKQSRLIEFIFSNDQTYLTDYLGVYQNVCRIVRKNEHFVENVSSKIILYWGVIGLCAKSLNVSVEGMALKVLAHEWGHAYSHVATDIDGLRWNSEGFSKSDRAVKEGIAQYCTLKVVEALEDRIPDAKKAYERLYPLQPEPYRAHLAWLEFSAEEIRQAILLARRSGQSTIGQFHNALNSARVQLRKSSDESSQDAHNY